RIFDICENRIHAIFLFLSMLEMVQQRFFNILIGDGKNNFIVEWNEEGPQELAPNLPAALDPVLN
ncbi:MAG: hypothetical protein MUF29_11135, partial [Chitinophagaceae bacterium]|nr:hypothetical protein [Chitinophagaceae bacterium]